MKLKYHTCSLLRSLGGLALWLPFLATAGLDYRITPYNATLSAQWQADLAAMPVYQLPPGYANTSGTVNLLPHLHDDPITRDQGNTGTCWLWGFTAVMSIDYDVQHGGKPVLANGLSVEFAAANLGFVNSSLQSGGSPETFKHFYEAVGFALPWTNAVWTDGSGCNKTPSAWIPTQPNCPLSQMTFTQLPTWTNDPQFAIATIKSVLDAGKPLWFNLTLANEADWSIFMAYWGKRNLTEDAIIDLAYGAGHMLVFEQGGGSHTMACVGYDDTDPNPTNHYWIILNSWGTADGHRPNAVFHMAMNTQYDASVTNSMQPYRMFEFGTLDTVWSDKVHKGVAALAVNLQSTNSGANTIQISGVSFAPALAPTNAYSAILTFMKPPDDIFHFDNQAFACDPANGTWTRDTNGFHYLSHGGVVPSLQLDINPVTCIWSFVANNVSGALNRYLDSHYGLAFNLTVQPVVGSDSDLGLRAFVYDELVNGGSSQFTWAAPDPPALSLSLKGTQGVLRIAGETGRTYQVQAADALNGAWLLQATVSMTQPVELVTVPAPVATNRFWRVQAQ
jgi:hypothetical protein